MHRIIERCRGSYNERRGLLSTLLHLPLFTKIRANVPWIGNLSLIGHNWQKLARMELHWKPFSHVFNFSSKISCIYFSNSAERGIYFSNSAERGLMALVLLKNSWVPMDISKTPSKFHGFDWISLNFRPNLVPRPLMTKIGANAIEMETLKFQILEVNDQFFVGLNYF
jgi:hypothetical protein